VIVGRYKLKENDTLHRRLYLWMAAQAHGSSGTDCS